MDKNTIILAKITSRISNMDINDRKHIIDYLVDNHNWSRDDAARVILKQIPLYYLTYNEFVLFREAIAETTGLLFAGQPDRLIFSNTSILLHSPRSEFRIDNAMKLLDRQYSLVMSTKDIAQLGEDGIIKYNVSPTDRDHGREYMSVFTPKKCTVSEVARLSENLIEGTLEVPQSEWDAVRGVSYDLSSKSLLLAGDSLIIPRSPALNIAICNMINNVEYRKKIIGNKFPITIRGVKEGV